MKTARFILVIAGVVSFSTIAGAGEKQASASRPSHGDTSAIDEGKLNEVWNALSPREKAAALRFHHALRQMPAEERRFLHDRVERFMQMSPDERGRLKENNERWQKMSPEERQQARDKFSQRRKEFEEKWKQEHPGEEPPPFLSRLRNKSEQKQNPNTQESKP